MMFSAMYRFLRPFDVVSLAFLSFLSVLNLIFYNRVGEWWILVIGNCAVSVGIVVLAVRYSDRSTKNPLRIVRDWYPVGVILYVFNSIYYMIYPIRGKDFDDILIQIDYWMFGVNPTEWIAQFSHPVLTELLQIVYASYYFLFLIAGYELYRRKLFREFNYFILIVVYGFFLSYIGYFLVPAIGPRFTLHDFHMKNEELPGLFLTDIIRELLNRGEFIPPGVANPEDYVHRDAFPSGHTQLTMVLLYGVWMYRLHCRRYMYVLGTLLIFSTVYLWYHYVIDLIAAVVFFGVTIATAPYIDRWWIKRREAESHARHLP
jgi:membrane-associated phospholipid phosphatase